jgi:transposase InsO family protein
VLNEDPEHFMQHPSFMNKPPLQPVNSYTTMGRIQADLVDLSAVKVKVDSGTTYRYVLVMVDVFSRFLWLMPLTDKASATVCASMETVMQTFGKPKKLHTDNGGEFAGEVNVFCRKHGIKKITGRPHHPQTQGKVSSGTCHEHLKVIPITFWLL